ncbi:thioesterase [Salmonella enterica subsp. enterica serovar Infantis]|nr:thioesterase [Salmonella enterica]EHA1743119.1 thioesterase [Salmonella enterica subsp. enterica serovar Javiana]EHC4525251.1 thioesterase [Salmonella enterica subsp. enterica serovar Infantis]ECL4818266.1 thioesterase [Salmonella enterica]EHJ8320777.1 thioesterase [Salmonella enterica subsp. enterica serovar Infantis]
MTELWVMRETGQDQREKRLFCFPYAGAGASVYRDWATHVPENVQICRIQLPGRENRLNEPAFTQLEPLVSRLLEAMAPLITDKQFVLFGHSMGGILVFELCRRLAQQGGPLPEKVFLSATRPPHLADPSPLHHLPDPEFIEALRIRGGTAEAMLSSPVFLEIFAPALRCDLMIAESWHQPNTPPLPVQLVVLNGRQDNIVKVAGREVWQRYSTVEPWVIDFDGGHFFIHSHAQAVRQAVFSRLNDCTGNEE